MRNPVNSAQQIRKHPGSIPAAFGQSPTSLKNSNRSEKICQEKHRINA
ncbi:hypothetical protein FACS1894137_17760 [Spirochaetia bacterium]|nr:hypothetical protein FACS1894137_17760 [Spirochaetia bacterium]